MVLISTELIGTLIALNFGLNQIIIDIETDELELNEKKLNTNNTYYTYNKQFLKSKNRKKEKVCIKELVSYPYILKIERGYDGRLFFLLFNEQNLRKYRSPPKWKASYFNRTEFIKEWYEQDLRNPKKIFNLKPKEKIITLMDYTCLSATRKDRKCSGEQSNGGSHPSLHYN